MADPPAPLPDHFPSLIVHYVTTSHEGLICEDIMLEHAEKLEFHKHPPERVERYLGHLAGTCESVDIIRFYCEPRPVDPDDIVFVLCALNGNAHFLISDDHHLTDLKDAYDPPKIRTREQMREPLSFS